MKPHIVGDIYQLDRRLGGGSYGAVYLGKNMCPITFMTRRLIHAGHHLETGEEVALKLEYNQTGSFHASRIFNSKGYIHRDVKPDTLLMGVGTQGNKVYTTDIGLGKEIEDPDRRTYSVVGTLRYASINTHLGKEHSPHDDMESLGYVLLYFLKGSLPCQDLKCKSTEKEKMILSKKLEAEKGSLFNGVPVEFEKYFVLIRSEKELDYGRLQRLFQGLFRRRSFQYDNVFDWTVLRFLETMAKLETK